MSVCFLPLTETVCLRVSFLAFLVRRAACFALGSLVAAGVCGLSLSP